MSFVRFTPRRPIKSFTDLEVYQKLLNIAVVVVKRLTPVSGGSASQEQVLRSQLQEVVLSLPMKVAEAHSVRFSDKIKGLAVLEEVMLGCNRAVVFLELYRDVAESGIEAEFFEEQIKNLQTSRWKVMHLARSWEKFSQTAE